LICAHLEIYFDHPCVNVKGKGEDHMFGEKTKGGGKTPSWWTWLTGLVGLMALFITVSRRMIRKNNAAEKEGASVPPQPVEEGAESLGQVEAAGGPVVTGTTSSEAETGHSPS
jgi:hypothetical protein